MREVVCWCCNHFIPHTGKKNVIWGVCEITDLPRFAEDAVCKEFLWRQGFYSNRTIPSYCKNYNKKL